METVNCLRCDFRHKDNGNCTAVGGFCTAVPAAHCPMLRKYLDTGLTPELVQETAELAIWIYENGLEKIKEWIKAGRDGRLVVLSSNKALTNADRMRTATNQQLAELLYNNQKELCRLIYKTLGFENELKFSEDYSDILAWLNTSEKGEESLGEDEG
nr:MAG TPA: hypothetical protein [Caudoviricetes sp.]